MRKLFVGLDLGSSSCHLVAIDKDKAIVRDRQFDTGEANLISEFKALKGEIHVHFEAGELASWVRRVLKGRVKRIVVGHAKSSAWIAKDPLKRDRLDALKLAELLRMDQVHEVYYPDDEHRTLFKQLVQHYEDVTEQAKRLKQKIKAALREQGVIARGEGVYTVHGRNKFLSQVPAGAARESIEQLYELLDASSKTRLDAMRLLRRECRRYPEISRFQGVPGIGLTLACRFSAYVQTPHRFSSKRKLWRYCRLGITDRRSDGKSLGRQKLDWNGIGGLKDLSRKAYAAAMICKADNAFKRSYRSTLQRTHSTVHARLSTQRKVLTVLWTMWKEGSDYQDEKG